VKLSLRCLKRTSLENKNWNLHLFLCTYHRLHILLIDDASQALHKHLRCCVVSETLKASSVRLRCALRRCHTFATLGSPGHESTLIIKQSHRSGKMSLEFVQSYSTQPTLWWSTLHVAKIRNRHVISLGVSRWLSRQDEKEKMSINISQSRYAEFVRLAEISKSLRVLFREQMLGDAGNNGIIDQPKGLNINNYAISRVRRWILCAI